MIEPLVLLPAMMCDARMWHAHLEAFAHERPVMVVPTHLAGAVGEAAAQVLEAAPRRFALAGVGLGSVVAMEVLRRAPERVTRAALLAADALAEPPVVAAAREPGIVAARAGRVTEMLRASPSVGALGTGPGRETALALAREMAADLGAEVFIRQSRMMQRRPDQQRTLRQFRAPVLLMMGAEDTSCSERHQEFLAQLMPAATLEVVPGAGHLLPLEAPGPVARAMDGWMRAPYRLT